MAQSVATMPLQDSIADESDRLHIHSDPLRTGAGFVLGTALSSTLWIVAGTIVWYLT